MALHGQPPPPQFNTASASSLARPELARQPATLRRTGADGKATARDVDTDLHRFRTGRQAWQPERRCRSPSRSRAHETQTTPSVQAAGAIHWRARIELPVRVNPETSHHPRLTAVERNSLALEGQLSCTSIAHEPASAPSKNNTSRCLTPCLSKVLWRRGGKLCTGPDGTQCFPSNVSAAPGAKAFSPLMDRRPMFSGDQSFQRRIGRRSAFVPGQAAAARHRQRCAGGVRCTCDACDGNVRQSESRTSGLPPSRRPRHAKALHCDGRRAA